MKNAEGSWEGTNTLWLKYPEDPQESAAKMVVSPARIEYSWAYQGEPQTGTFVFSGSGDQLSAQWTDTWHAKDSMACSGTERDGVVKVTGTYSAGDGPDWSWRTEFRLDAPEQAQHENVQHPARQPAPGPGRTRVAGRQHGPDTGTFSIDS